jgi:hypothetical protein
MKQEQKVRLTHILPSRDSSSADAEPAKQSLSSAKVALPSVRVVLRTSSHRVLAYAPYHEENNAYASIVFQRTISGCNDS